MQASMKHTRRQCTLKSAVRTVLEALEGRTLLTGTTFTAWDFNSLAVATNAHPAASVGSGAASTLGMTMDGGTDASDVMAGTGSNGGSSDGTTGNIWRVRGGNGWTNTAGIGTQGAQFSASTAGYSQISVSFDAYATTTAENKLAVEYTTDGSTWVVAPASILTLGSASTSNTAIGSNSSSSNTVNGGYFLFSGAQAWHNGLTVDLSGFASAVNDANFGIRLVSASTGTDCYQLNGTSAWINTGNWRFDEVKIAGTAQTFTAPVVTQQPASQIVSTGSSVTLTSTASGSPTPTVQWQVSTNGGTTWSDIAGATSTSYTFTAQGSDGGKQYHAVFTVPSFAPVTSNAATLTVTTPIVQWNFNNLAAGANTAPVPASGTGTAASIGMALLTGPDTSNIMATDGGSSDGSNGGSLGGGVWRVVGTNGWNSGAGIATQGAQFGASTVNDGGISVQFDWYATTQGEGKLAVQYTTDGTTWVNANSISLPAGSSNITILDNTSGSTPNLVVGKSFQATGSQQWHNGLIVDLSGVSAANNDPNFAIRLVNAATGAACVNLAGTGINNTSGNWRFDEVKINASSSGPLVTAQPASQTVNSGDGVTFTSTASAVGSTPAVQWQVSTDSGATFTDIGGATATSYTFTAQSADTTKQYRAKFTSAGFSPVYSSAATLTVLSAPIVTLQPVSQSVNAGASVSFTSTASGNPAVQWQVSTDGGATFSDVGGATSTTYTFTSHEADTGHLFRAVFTKSGFAPVVSNSAALTVIGTPIAQWVFTTGTPSIPPALQGPGTVDQPYPTLSGHSTDIATILGMNNTYTGVQAFPEADVHAKQSTINSSFTEYVWRVRGGNGSGPTGSPGTPEAWSQNAPQYSQGVQFRVNTAGFNNVTLSFDWNAGGVADMQAQYTADITAANPVWVNVPNGLFVAANGDYYGITPTTNPTGVLVNLQGVAGASDNPNLGIRLVSAYDPSLPQINDGNLLVPGLHGQYSKTGTGAVNDMQVLTFGGGDLRAGQVTGGTFTLTFNGQTTGDIAYSTTPATTAANIQAALVLLSNIGAGNVSVAPYVGDVTQSRYTISFNGTMAHTDEPDMTATSSLTGGVPTVTAATWVHGSTNGSSRYVDGGGAWELGNFRFNGDNVTLAPGVTVPPASQTITRTTAATFTATAYSETAITSAQWQVSINGGTSWSDIAGANNLTGAVPSYTSTYTTPAASDADNGHQYRVVFTNGAGAQASIAAILSVVAPVPVNIRVQPHSTSVMASSTGSTFLYTYATGVPTPTLQWQSSSDGGATWNDVPLATNNTLVIAAPSLGQSGSEYRVAFTSAGVVSYSNVATLTVLPAESVITAWTFNGSQAAGYNNPTPTTGSGSATGIGMDRDYNYLDASTGDGNTYNGGTAYGSAQMDDVTNQASPGITGFSEYIWRVRGGVPGSSPGFAGTPSNGWSNFADPETQGAQFNVSTVGYSHVYLTMDWYSTQSGVRDMQGQYTVDGSTWHDFGSTFEANPVEDYYGVAQTGKVVPLVFDTANITGADAALVANNPNFGIRVVSVYNPFLLNITDAITGLTHGQYANASPNNPADPTSTVAYNGSKGNWRFANIVFHGTPPWLDPTSAATWNPATKALSVTGAAKIIADPGADMPDVTLSGSAALTIAPAGGTLVSLHSLSISGGTVDLAGNALVLATGADTGIRGFVAGGNIISTGMPADGNHGIGVLLASDAAANGNSEVAGGAFHGVSVSPGSILVQAGPNGDLNMDRQVNYLDYGVIDNGYLGSLSGYAHGDLTGDGHINYLDYGMMDNAYLAATAPHSAAAAQAAMAPATTEPAVVTAGTVFATNLIGKRPDSSVLGTDNVTVTT